MHVSKTFRNRRSTTIWIEAFRTINLWSAIWKPNTFYLFIDLAQNSLNLIFKWKQKNPVILCIYCSYWIMITQINLPSLTPRVLPCLIFLPTPAFTHTQRLHICTCLMKYADLQCWMKQMAYGNKMYLFHPAAKL